MKKGKFFVRHYCYKKEAEGYIVEHNNRYFAIHKANNKWNITDIKTGLLCNRGHYNTKNEALESLKKIKVNFENKNNSKAEKMLEKLPLFEIDTIYIYDIEEIDSNNTIYRGEINSKYFELPLFHDGSVNVLEVDYDKFEGNFEDEEIDSIADRIYENNFITNKLIE